MNAQAKDHTSRRRLATHTYWLLTLSALAVAAILLLGSVIAFQTLVKERPSDDQQVFDASNLADITGNSRTAGSSIVIEHRAPDTETVLSSAALRLSADRFTEVSWSISSPNDGLKVQLIWVNRIQPEVLKAIVLEAADLARKMIDMSAHPQWSGHIGAIGLRISQAQANPVTVEWLQLAVPAPSISSVLFELAAEWRFYQPWDDTSINYHVGGPRFGIAPAALVAAVWGGLAALTYLSLVATLGARRRLWPLCIIFMAAWLVLDLRWQWGLVRQLAATHQQFAGQDWNARREADRDGHLFKFAQQLKRELPSAPARIFLIESTTDAAAAFVSLRTHYHLLPHNVYSFFSSTPPAERIRPGDFVLLMQPTQDVSYEPDGQRILWQDGQLRAQLVVSADEGVLFRALDTG